MEAIAKILEDQNPKSKEVRHTADSDLFVNVDTIELTDIEKTDVLAKALILKKASVRTKQYWHKIKNVAPKKLMNEGEVRNYFFAKFKSLTGKEFIVDDESEHVLDVLVAYFSKSDRFEKMGDYDLKKGLCLFGNVGCGKTDIMRAFQTNQIASYRMASTIRISNDYHEHGGSIIDKYSKLDTEIHQGRIFGQKKFGWCFDDVGDEEFTGHFGTKVSVIAMILQRQYSLKLFNHIHITTNLTGDQVAEYYGERLSSRMREMFNVISFPERAKDRRK